MNRWLFPAVLVGASFLLSGPAHACQCGSGQDARRAFAEAPHVVEVRITSQWVTPYRDRRFGFLNLARTFDGTVVRVLKGPRASQVRFADAEGDCSFSFRPGKTYLVYARPNPNRAGFFDSTVCDLTAEVSIAGDQYRLLGFHAPEPTTSTRESTVHKATRSLATAFLVGTVRFTEASRRLIESHPVRFVWVRLVLLLSVPLAALVAWRYRQHVRLALAIAAGASVISALFATAAGWHFISSSPLASQWFK